MRAFLDSKPYAVIPERDPNTGSYLWRVAVRARPDSRLSHIAGDCIHNIRAPLDNLAWLLASGASEKDRRNAAFVIQATSQDFRSKWFRLAGLPERASEIVAELQPFHPNQLPSTLRYRAVVPGGQTVDIEDPYARADERGRAETHPLFVLERLWNEDKHRAPALIGAVSRSARVGFSGVQVPPGGEYRQQFAVGIVHDGDVLATFEPVNFRTEGEVHFEPTFEVSLDKDGKALVGPVIPLLRGLHDFVRDVVLPKFAEI